MCGIVGYNGSISAKKVIIDGLHSLEYRGYDSAGLTLMHNNEFLTYKCSGKVSNLEHIVKGITDTDNCGIGHTRWATHGEPSTKNAHPHESQNCVVVHNGIIENYLEIKNNLITQGYTFKSDTDTECIAHLLDCWYKKTNNTHTAIRNTMNMLTGSFAVAVMFKDKKDEIWAFRRDNPLIVAKCDDGCYLASDIPALLKYTNKIIRPDDDEIIFLTKKDITIFDKNDKEKEYKTETIDWSIGTAQKEGFSHFMLKEIHEQPTAIYNAIKPLINNGLPSFDEDFEDIDSISIISCGSATHAGLVGKYLIEQLAKIPVFVTTASEFRYSPPVTVGNTLCIPISQSGETADTLAALRLCKKMGYKSIAIINAVGSAIAREADKVIYTNAGPEIAVATTKGYTTQVAVLSVLAVAIALSKNKISEADAMQYCETLINDLPKLIKEIISKNNEIRNIAQEIYNNNDMYFIGRGIDSYASVEGSLKLKEISYIHSESYAAGELKHGTLSLIEDGTPVIALCCDEKYYDKMIGNIREVSSRGGKIILVCKNDFPNYSEYCDMAFLIPNVLPNLSPLLSVVFSQLLSYHVALFRGCDIDHPRNLAKSVTVE